MTTRPLAVLAILLSLSGCALGPVGIAADVLGGFSMASLTFSGKGLGDQAVSAAAGQDCRVLEGMMRRDRGICEDYKTAAARPPYLVEVPPPPMPEIAIGQPFAAQPAVLAIAASAAKSASLPQPDMALPIRAAARQEIAPPAKAADAEKSDAPPAAAEKAAPAEPEKSAEPKPSAIVMESEDSMKLVFGGGHSDKEVMAQLHAAIAAWRETARPPPPAEPPAAAEAPTQAEAPAPAKPGAEAAHPEH